MCVLIRTSAMMLITLQILSKVIHKLYMFGIFTHQAPHPPMLWSGTHYLFHLLYSPTMLAFWSYESGLNLYDYQI